MGTDSEEADSLRLLSKAGVWSSAIPTQRLAAVAFIPNAREH